MVIHNKMFLKKIAAIGIILVFMLAVIGCTKDNTKVDGSDIEEDEETFLLENDDGANNAAGQAVKIVTVLVCSRTTGKCHAVTKGID